MLNIYNDKFNISVSDCPPETAAKPAAKPAVKEKKSAASANLTLPDLILPDTTLNYERGVKLPQGRYQFSWGDNTFPWSTSSWGDNSYDDGSRAPNNPRGKTACLNIYGNKAAIFHANDKIRQKNITDTKFNSSAGGTWRSRHVHNITQSWKGPVDYKNQGGAYSNSSPSPWYYKILKKDNNFYVAGYKHERKLPKGILLKPVQTCSNNCQQLTFENRS